MQSQLESFLSATADSVFESSAASASTSSSFKERAKISSAGTDIRLDRRLQLLELYTLHVLPRNDEWQYARDYICASKLLDSNNRDALIYALDERWTQEHSQSTPGKEKSNQQQINICDIQETHRRAPLHSKRVSTMAPLASLRYPIQPIDHQKGVILNSPPGAIAADNAPLQSTNSPPSTTPSPGEVSSWMRLIRPYFEHDVVAAKSQNRLHGLLHFIVFLLTLLFLTRLDIRDKLSRFKAVWWGRLKRSMAMAIMVSRH